MEGDFMIHHELMKNDAILIVTPKNKLESQDFDNLAKEVDPYLEDRGGLKGLMIYTESFPGWSDFAALISHLKFIKNHHQKIARIAAVTDGRIVSILPRIADHFVDAEVKHFEYEDNASALEWLKRK